MLDPQTGIFACSEASLPTCDGNSPFLLSMFVPKRMKAESSLLYLATGAGIERVDHLGSAPALLAIGNAADVALGATCAYWVDDLGGAVYAVGK